ncbi:MAG: CpaF family protein [Lachnospiraceae bacterium]|nr:CpaF family protein [Lachnospiraceae bacterium]MBR6909291.1 CpaF family protein [Lachnospiraceae bacterium]
MDYALLRNELKQNAQNRIDYRRDFSDEEVLDVIDEVITSSKDADFLKIKDRKKLRKEIFDSLRRLDVLQKFVDDPSVTEIMINGCDHIFVEKDGKLSEIEEKFESEEKLKDVIQQIVAGCNRVVNEASPIVDARLDNGSRVNIVMNPVALNGPIVTIRRFPENPITMDELISKRSISSEAASFLETLVKAKYNIFISGGTGSGKTTFLNVLSGFIPKGERVITIEDSAELQLQGIANLVRLETRNANTEGCEEISIRDLIRTSLRMRPDRIIVGEVRGAECWDMISGFNTGHSGGLSTGHANSARDMLSRLENMVMMGVEIPPSAIKQQIASGLEIIVHLGRLRDKSRKVLEISEVIGFENGEIVTSTLYRFVETGTSLEGRVLGELEKVEKLKNTEKLRLAGLSPAEL